MENSNHRIVFESGLKRPRVMFHGKTVAESLRAGLAPETGHRPVDYFPREDVRENDVEGEGW